MIKYLLVVFPYGSYEKAKGIMNALKITGKYKRVIDDNMPVYLKEGIKYQVFCIDHSRVKLPKIAVQKMVSVLSKKKVDVSDVITTNPSGWLEENGYEGEVTDALIL